MKTCLFGIWQVAAHAEMLVPILLAAESAAKGPGEPVEMDMSYGPHRVFDDALRLSSQFLDRRARSCICG